MDSLYRDILLNRYHNPRFKGLPQECFGLVVENPSCGDSVRVCVEKNVDGVITSVRWDGNGCVISQVGADLVAEVLVGKSVSDVLGLSADYTLALFETPIGTGRLRCATLGLDGVKKVLMNA